MMINISTILIQFLTVFFQYKKLCYIFIPIFFYGIDNHTIIFPDIIVSNAYGQKSSVDLYRDLNIADQESDDKDNDNDAVEKSYIQDQRDRISEFNKSELRPENLTPQQEQQITNQKEILNDIDPISENFLSNALTALRFVAISLDDKEDIGLAYSGIVRSFIVQNDIDSALREARAIEDPIWQARSLISIADYFNKTQDDKEKTIAILNEALDLFDVNENVNASNVLKELARQYSFLGDFKKSLEAISKISNIKKQLEFLRITLGDILKLYEIAANNQFNDANTTSLDETLALVNNILPATKIKIDSLGDLISIEDKVNFYVDIGKIYLQIGDEEEALKVFELSEQIIETQDSNIKQKLFPKLAEAIVPLQESKNAMRIVQKILFSDLRAIALSSVARAQAENNNTDSAVPLFALAKDEIKLFNDPIKRYKVLTKIIIDETRAGRLADAFNSAGLIDNVQLQALALYNMGQELTRLEKFKEAIKLINFIPVLYLRADLVSSLIEGINTSEQEFSKKFIDDILINALNETPLAIDSEKIVPAIQKILSSQIKYGDSTNDKKIFATALDIINTTQSGIERVIALVNVAKAYALRSRFDDASKLIDQAFRLTWLNRDDWLNSKEQYYALALNSITQGQLQLNDIYTAFDTAASIPEPSPETRIIQDESGRYIHPRYLAMQSIAVHAAKLEELDLAIRAANEVEFPAARAQILAFIAIADIYSDNELFDTNIFGFDFLKNQWVQKVDDIMIEKRQSF